MEIQMSNSRSFSFWFYCISSAKFRPFSNAFRRVEKALLGKRKNSKKTFQGPSKISAGKFDFPRLGNENSITLAKTATHLEASIPSRIGRGLKNRRRRCISVGPRAPKPRWWRTPRAFHPNSFVRWVVAPSRGRTCEVTRRISTFAPNPGISARFPANLIPKRRWHFHWLPAGLFDTWTGRNARKIVRDFSVVIPTWHLR